MKEEPFAPGEEAGEIDIHRYVSIVWRRRWIIAAVAVVGVTLAVIHTKRQTPVYSASASVLLDPSPPQFLDGKVQEVVQLGAGSYWSTAEYYNGQLAILNSYALSQQAAQMHRLDRLLEAPPNDSRTDAEKIEHAASVLNGALSISRDTEDPVVHITVTHPDPEVAAAFANAHVAAYIAYSRGLRTSATDDAKVWLSVELDKAAAELRETELSLLEFKRENDILSVSLEDRQNLVAGNIARYDRALNDARVRRLELGTLLGNIREAHKVDVLSSPIFALTDSETGRTLNGKYADKAREFASLKQQVGPKNPAYLELEQELAAIRVALEREADTIAKTAEARHRAALKLEGEYAKQLEDYTEQAFQLGPLEVDYNRLARKGSKDEERFGMLQGRMQTSDLTSRLQTVNVRPLDLASVPGEPLSQLRRNVLMALVVSLMLGVAMAFGLEQLNRTVKSVEEIELVAKATFLGLIPAVPVGNGDDAARDFYVHEKPMSPAAECCRAIRTNLMFAGADDELRTIVVASANPREGKTTTVMYLGTALAQSGLRTLIIDSDMRRPRIHRSIGTSETFGLSGMILGETTSEDAIKKTAVPNLFALPAGSPPPNPSELLMTRRFETVLEELGTQFDRILLDSPPLLAVTDGVILSRVADAVILVVRAGETRKADLVQAERVLADVNAHVAGIILNSADMNDRRYYYRYNYGYTKDGELYAAADREA